MWRNMLKTVAATAVYAGVHSALAGPAAKDRAARLVGRRLSDGAYRAF